MPQTKNSMKKIIPIFYFVMVAYRLVANPNEMTDAHLIGDVQANGQHIPFANIVLKGTTIGTVADGTGHFQLLNLPVGTYTAVASAIGYTSQEKTFSAERNKTQELKFVLTEDVLGLDEVVITGDRNAQVRTEAPVIVSTISPELFATTQSVTISEGLNFCPGLRTENNCANCGFTQVRMNGMEGPYSQILINSRPIFSGLAGVYGLEMIPSSMVEKIEVVRGGGSALYGGNAIAGTINLILKDPLTNSFHIGTNSSITGVGMSGTGGNALDHSINFDASVVADEGRTGLVAYGFRREKEPFDANNDGFSEMTKLQNSTVGTRLFHKFGVRSKVSADFFHIGEERRGGNKFDYLAHEADIAEAVEHSITTGAVTYEQFFRTYDIFSVFASGQSINRDSYYGAEQSLADYGLTRDLTYNSGAQYKALLGLSTITAGADYTSSHLEDTKLGYLSVAEDGSQLHLPNTTIANQEQSTIGAFGQYDIKWEKLKISLGARADNYAIIDHESNSTTKKGTVVSPRANILYSLLESLQLRASYSQGYRAPQIFDEDLHIETSGSRKVLHENSPDLKEEKSHSFMASADFNKKIGTLYASLLVEGFYTRLLDPFANEYGTPDSEGTVVYTRVNSEGGATIQGVNSELTVIPNTNVTATAGYTVQMNEFDAAQEFGEKRFFRTPTDYGFLALDWDITKYLCWSLSGNYTGSMLVPYFGNTINNPEAGELRTSKRFYDIGTKLEFSVPAKFATVVFTGGVKNIFNSYQSDFDSGIDRDPGYMYGPATPRTVYFGVKVGNIF